MAWIAPIYRQAKIAFRYFKKIFKNTGLMIKKPNETNLEITLINDRIIQFRSGDNPDYIEGEGYKAVVLDEAWKLLSNESLWFNSIRPTLADYEGRGLIISRADFEDTLLHRFYLKGGNKDNKDIISYNFKTEDNPQITDREIITLKEELPTNAFKQQILGEFLDSEGRAIPNIDECAISTVEDSGRGKLKPYVIGVDLAKHQDYTVIMVGRGGHVINYQRFNKIAWPVQEQIIKETAKRFCDAKIILDSTGVGDPIYDHLLDLGLDVDPYKFTESSRTQLLDLLILRMGQRLLTFLPEKQIIRELKSMRWEIKPSGRAKLMVPEPNHDDCVMSLALCNWGMSGILKSHIDVKKDVSLMGDMESVGSEDNFI